MKGQTMLDINKPIQTRDGRPVEILTFKGRSSRYPIVGYVGDSTDTYTWTVDGTYLVGDVKPTDLVNTSQKHIGYANVYLAASSEGLYNIYSYPTRDHADRMKAGNRIACIRIEFVEGQNDV